MKSFERTAAQSGSLLFPESLTKIKNPPKTLYLEGNADLLKEKCVAVIGTRDMTEKSRDKCMALGKFAVTNKIPLITGGALGCDSEALFSAVFHGGKCMVVLPCGLDILYPPDNRRLFADVLNKGGLLISEYEDGTHPDKKIFLERNRLITGLSSAVIVVQAEERSGTLSAAREALRQGKDIFLCEDRTPAEKELLENGAKILDKKSQILSLF